MTMVITGGMVIIPGDTTILIMTDIIRADMIRTMLGDTSIIDTATITRLAVGTEIITTSIDQ
jgi:hypothetical protein